MTRIHSYIRILMIVTGLFTLAALSACGDDDSPTQPAATNPWSTDGFTWTAPFATDGSYPSDLQFRKVGNMVYLRGHANAGNTHVQSGQVIGTLPAGYCPTGNETVFLLGATWGWPTAYPSGYVGTAGISIGTDGSITVRSVKQYDGEQQFLSFDSLAFSTASGSDGWSGDGIAWTDPYVADGTYLSTLEYSVSGTMVRLQGAANAGATRVTAGQQICTLPEGCRPPEGQAVHLLCATWGWPGSHPAGYVGTAGVIILPDGRVLVRTVQEYDGQQQFLKFDGQAFSTVTGASGWSGDGIAWTAPYAPDEPYPSTLEINTGADPVLLRGFANAGGVRVSTGQTVCTLPTGARPPASVTPIMLCPTWGWPAASPAGYIGTAGMMLFPDGSLQVVTVQQFDAEQQFVCFDGKGFSPAD
ncbi:MAG: hypothetical protein R6X25_06985 [Candidatus Krumholzibacteriia bacterium]